MAACSWGLRGTPVVGLMGGRGSVGKPGKGAVDSAADKPGKDAASGIDPGTGGCVAGGCGETAGDPAAAESIPR